jgi:hypothetical protein
MAVKAGEILHVADGFLVDRIQSGGVTSLNINEEVIEELGNYQNVGTIRDIPDLTFEIESFDMSTGIENILTNRAESFATGGTLLDLSTELVDISIMSPFKSSGAFTTVKSILIPHLALESLSYNFSLNDAGSLTATMRGDSLYYSPGDVYYETFNGDGIATAFTYGMGTGGVAGPTIKTVIDGTDYWVLAVEVDGVRQRQGASNDYTATSTVITFNTSPPSGTDNIEVYYAHSTAQTYGQGLHDITKPAGVKGRFVEVVVSDFGGATNRISWTGVQSATLDWRATIERDEEFNNPFIVAQDFDTPEVTGTLGLKASDATVLWDKIMQVTDLDAVTEVANATQEPPQMDVEVIVKDPADGTTLKTLIVPDAKFTVPAMQGQVGNKLETDFTFTSAGGVLEIYVGDN